MASSESRRVVLIVAAFIVIGVGGALYYLLVFQPGRDREAARASITEWEAKWDAARTCLLGKEPLAADIGDAMAARELLIGTTDAAMGECTKVVGALTRPPGNDSGVDAVERAWPALEQAVSTVAQAYGTHRQRPLGDNPLPAALDEVVAAHTALRAAAGMSPPPKPAAPAAIKLAPTPLLIDGATVADLGGITVGGTLRGRANVNGKGAYDVTWTPQGLTGTLVEHGVRSVPNRTWGLDVDIADDDSSTLTAGENRVTVDTAKTTIIALLAIGEAKERIAVYSVNDRIRIARSADGGSTWAVQPILAYGEVAFTATPTGDRLDLAWTDPKATTDGLMVMSLTPANAKGPLPAPTTLPAQELATWCTGGALWIIGATAKGYVVFPNGKAPGVELALSQPRPVACNDQRLALRSGGGGAPGEVVDQVCSATACTPLPSVGDERPLSFVGEHAYRADSRGNVVAVWRDAEPVKLFHIPSPRDVYGIADVGGTPVLLLVDVDKLALEQAPLPP